MKCVNENTIVELSTWMIGWKNAWMNKLINVHTNNPIEWMRLMNSNLFNSWPLTNKHDLFYFARGHMISCLKNSKLGLLSQKLYWACYGNYSDAKSRLDSFFWKYKFSRFIFHLIQVKRSDRFILRFLSVTACTIPLSMTL